MCCLVADESHQSVVHKALAMNYSTYIADSLHELDQDDFRDLGTSKLDKLQLPSTNPDTLDAFVGWLYTGNIPSTTALIEELWVFGEKLGAPAFQNELMHLLFAFHIDEYVSARALHFVERNTDEDCVLWQYTRDQIKAQGTYCEGEDEIKEEWLVSYFHVSLLFPRLLPD